MLIGKDLASISCQRFLISYC